MAKKLALFGGKPTFTGRLPATYNIGAKEQKAVSRVLKSGLISDFLGRAGSKFLGGEEVRKLERAFTKKFHVKYAVAFNSGTTALEAMVAALELGPGSEIIVSPYTMSATFTSVLTNNHVPIFADIDEKNFCLNPAAIESKITKRTRAIFTTNLFGGSPDYASILSLCKKYKLKLLEDNAQAAGGKYKSKYLGTIGDMGVFSFNVHKTIQAGEGGILVTNNEDLAFRAQLKRNHAEQVLDDLGRDDIFVIGSNYRMSEIHAAICLEQLKKLDFLNKKRIALANYLTQGLRRISGIAPFFVSPEVLHVYYAYPILFDEEKFGISRDKFAKAIGEEGFELNEGYIKPMHLLSLFQGNTAYKHIKFLNKGEYKRGTCPIAEKMYDIDLLLTNICRYPLNKKHIDLFIRAITKIKENIREFLP